MPFLPHSTTLWPSFRPRRERIYEAHLISAQVRGDLAFSFIVIIAFAVIVRKDVAMGRTLQAAYGIAGGINGALPLVLFALNASDYAALRTRMVLVWLSLGWHFGTWSRSGATPWWDVPPVGSGFYGSLHLLHLANIHIQFWANLGLRVPFYWHLLTHGIGTVFAISWNASSCRWAMEQSSTGLPWVRALARTMRRAAWVPAQSEGSLGATRVGECRTGVAFLQMAIGYVTPCAVALVLELRSRLAFLEQRYQSRLQRAPDPARVPRPKFELWDARNLLTPHLAWAIPVLLLALWWVAEWTTKNFPAL